MNIAIRKLKIALPVLLLLAMVSALAVATSGVKVIANPSVKPQSISADDLKRVFLGVSRSLADGSRVQPVLAKSGPAHEAFIKSYLGKSDAALQTYYRCLVFTGKGLMPKTVNSDAEMVEYVAKTTGAIGYVSAGADSKGVKTLQVEQ